MSIASVARPHVPRGAGPPMRNTDNPAIRHLSTKLN